MLYIRSSHFMNPTTPKSCELEFGWSRYRPNTYEIRNGVRYVITENFRGLYEILQGPKNKYLIMRGLIKILPLIFKSGSGLLWVGFGFEAQIPHLLLSSSSQQGNNNSNGCCAPMHPDPCGRQRREAARTGGERDIRGYHGSPIPLSWGVLIHHVAY